MPIFQVVTVNNAIKVTVDGPRDSRNSSKYLNGIYFNFLKFLFVFFRTFN